MSENFIHKLDFDSGLQGDQRLAYLIGYAEAHGSVTLSKDLAEAIMRLCINQRLDLRIEREQTDKLRKKIAELKKKLKEKA